MYIYIYILCVFNNVTNGDMCIYFHYFFHVLFYAMYYVDKVAENVL